MHTHTHTCSHKKGIGLPFSSDDKLYDNTWLISSLNVVSINIRGMQPSGSRWAERVFSTCDDNVTCWIPTSRECIHSHVLSCTAFTARTCIVTDDFKARGWSDSTVITVDRVQPRTISDGRRLSPYVIRLICVKTSGFAGTTKTRKNWIPLWSVD